MADQTPDPWKNVKQYRGDLPDEDVLDVDVYLTTDVDRARDAEQQQHQQMIHERIRLHDLVLEVLAAWSESENEDDIVKRARVRTAFRERLRSGGLAEHQQTIQQQAAQIKTLTQALEEISRELQCAKPCRPLPDCETCGARRGNYWCAGCVAREALAGASRPTEGGN